MIFYVHEFTHCWSQPFLGRCRNRLLHLDGSFFKGPKRGGVVVNDAVVSGVGQTCGLARDPRVATGGVNPIPLQFQINDAIVSFVVQAGGLARDPRVATGGVTGTARRIQENRRCAK